MHPGEVRELQHFTFHYTVVRQDHSNNDHCGTESAPTSPGSRVDPGRQKSNDPTEHSAGRLTADYPILPVLSSSAPEREGIWHEVKRKSTDRIKVTTPKETTPSPRIEVRFVNVFFCYLMFRMWLLISVMC